VGKGVTLNRRSVEWRTVGLLVAFFAAFGSLIGWHRQVPWPIELIALTLLGGLWMSLGHELLHGHPTRWNAVNTMIGFIPLSLWIPFARYKSTHIQHHHCDLTDPFDDPESSYTDPVAWAEAGRVKRTYLTVLRTSVGRFTIGVPRTVLRYWASDARRFATEPMIAVQWIAHLAATVVLGWLLFGVWHVPVLTYVFGFVLGGAACTMLRSFAEHRAVADGSRSAVVTAGPGMSLLFLNNNLHHAHHARPNVPWYDVPSVARELNSVDAAAHGAGLYRSYIEVLCRYAVTPFDRAEHPLTAGRER
jgi:fatty acid desaturase